MLRFQLNIINDLQIEFDFNEQVAQEEDVPRRRRWYKERTSTIFFDKMADFEFLRMFRFSKEGVLHLTSLLGNTIRHL